MTEKYSQPFEKWGYLSEDGCWMCNNKPARIEPRFGYRACKDHYHVPPVRFNHAPFRPKGS